MPFELELGKCNVFVCGTGLTECIVAAACTRIGQTVIHVDGNDYYGSQWASFSFDRLRAWIADYRNVNAGDSLGHDSVDWHDTFQPITNVEEISYVIESDDSFDGWTLDKLKKSSRQFNLDLVPRVIYSQGAMVDLLVKSNICRYLEFKCVSRLLSFVPKDDDMSDVPCSRGDIFNSKSISIIQKRMLMKFMNFCLELDKAGSDLQEFEGIMFTDLLKGKGIDDTLQHYLINSIAMLDNQATAIEALQALRKFTGSAGRFGNTPFIWPLYGAGELPQAFCRLCAVFGGTYCLSQHLDGMETNNDEDNRKVLTHVILNGQKVACNHLVIGIANVPKKLFSSTPLVKTSRAIFLTTRPLKAAEKDGITLIRIPGHGHEITKHVTLIEAGHASYVTPTGINVVYASCRSEQDQGEEADISNAKRDLLPVAKKLFQLGGNDDESSLDTRPQLLWSCYFNQLATDEDISVDGLANVHVTNSPTGDPVDYETSINEAHRIFKSMFPEEEFLPRAPDAEDIVIESQENDVTD